MSNPAELTSLMTNLFNRINDVDIWQINMSEFYSKEEELFALLSETEKIRTKKFAFPHLSTRYTIAHSILRLLLSRYTGLEPNEINFKTRVKGKPYLSINPHQLEFNLSDSHERALIGFSMKDEIGVDIQVIDPNILSKGLQNTIFTENERKIFRKHPNPLEAFYCGWTHKEATMKLLGTGLYIEPAAIEVPLVLASETRTIHYENTERFIRSFLLGTQYYVAIASNKPDFKINELNFTL